MLALILRMEKLWIQRLKKYKEAIEILENVLYKVPPRDKHIKQKA